MKVFSCSLNLSDMKKWILFQERVCSGKIYGTAMAKDIFLHNKEL